MDTAVITDTEARHLKWLAQATDDTEARPILSCLHLTEKNILTADGFRIHALPRNPESTFNTLPADGMLKHVQVESNGKNEKKSLIPTGGGYMPVAFEGGNPPDFAQIMPTDKPVFEIAVNAEYLREALQGANTEVVLRFYGKDRPLEVYGTRKPAERWSDGLPFYALVMPMQIDFRDRNWRPIRPFQQQ